LDNAQPEHGTALGYGLRVVLFIIVLVYCTQMLVAKEI
jgi:hypothetical protein